MQALTYSAYNASPNLPALTNAGFFSDAFNAPQRDRNSMALGDTTGQVVWVDFSRKVVQPVDHCAEAAKLLSDVALRPIMDELSEFEAFEEGWDGPGSVKPHEKAVQAARRFVKDLAQWSHLPEVSLAPDGEISVYWRNDDLFIDMSFSGPDRASLYSRIHDQVYRQTYGVDEAINLPFETAMKLIVE